MDLRTMSPTTTLGKSSSSSDAVSSMKRKGLRPSSFEGGSSEESPSFEPWLLVAAEPRTSMPSSLAAFSSHGSWQPLSLFPSNVRGAGILLTGTSTLPTPMENSPRSPAYQDKNPYQFIEGIGGDSRLTVSGELEAGSPRSVVASGADAATKATTESNETSSLPFMRKK